MVGELELKILNGIFQLAGTFFSSHIASNSDDEQKKNLEKYYKRVSKIIEDDRGGEARKNEKLKKLEQALEKDLKPMMEKLETQSHAPLKRYAEDGEDLSEKKIIEGKSCLPCSSEHIGQAASLLKEAVRFAVRDKGIRDEEVEDRVHDALLELNALERKDLTPEKIERMRPDEKELAVFYMNKSAEIRHKLNNIKEPDDLIQASALATKISKELHKKVWSMSTSSGTVDHLCTKAGMTSEEKEACIEMVNQALEKE